MFLQIYKILSNFDSNALISNPTVFPTRSFPPLLFIFFDFGHLQGETGGQSWTKSANFGSVSFSLKLKSFKLFKQCFCLLEYYLWWKLRQYWTTFEGARAQKPPKKSHFKDAESVRRTLETFNLTTTNAILMKCNTVIYLHGSVNQKPLRARNSVFWRNVYEFLD